MDLTDAHMDFINRLRNGLWLPTADRKQDRIRQQLRKAGMIQCVMNPRRWVITEFGHDILRRVDELAA